jgi:PIN domain nuclease of toxin-antitoxin system
VKLLLDTHAFLWFVQGDLLLSAAASDAIENTDNPVFISPATLWELAIKVQLGKYVLKQPFTDFIDSSLKLYQFQLLAITPEHAAQLATLPRVHADPFDRMLIAQAMVDDLTLVSKDTAIQHDPVRWLW